MNKLLLFFAVMLFAATVDAQTTDTTKTKDATVTVTEPSATNPNVFLTIPEHAPEFPGGMQAFYHFLGMTIRYPGDARQKNIQGRVVVQFVVETDGSITNVKIVKSVFPSIDDEALRVIKLSPKWKPGMTKGAPVRGQISIPISFTLG